jgi:hypothetical protein
VRSGTKILIKGQVRFQKTSPEGQAEEKEVGEAYIEEQHAEEVVAK